MIVSKGKYLCMYVFMHVCMYIYIIYIYMCVYMYVCMYVCMSIQIYRNATAGYPLNSNVLIAASTSTNGLLPPSVALELYTLGTVIFMSVLGTLWVLSLRAVGFGFELKPQ